MEMNTLKAAKIPPDRVLVGNAELCSPFIFLLIPMPLRSKSSN